MFMLKLKNSISSTKCPMVKLNSRVGVGLDQVLGWIGFILRVGTGGLVYSLSRNSKDQPEIYSFGMI
jgi:hypothetical protein